ncbi:MAG: nucleotidyltransferase family protein, partial [Polyangiaceae bacterium]|nr:nucleotidyltransferase family protein [Polyangiaceae bacterium]
MSSAAERGWVFLAGIVARGLVGRCARALDARGIPVMALKGAALHALIYEDPADRPLSDVDLLVRPRDHARAIVALESIGFRPVAPTTSWATSLVASDQPLSVDLHRRLFPTGLFRLRVEELFARAHLDTTTFGAPVRLPDAYDL